MADIDKITPLEFILLVLQNICIVSIENYCIAHTCIKPVMKLTLVLA